MHILRVQNVFPSLLLGVQIQASLGVKAIDPAPLQLGLTRIADSSGEPVDTIELHVRHEAWIRTFKYGMEPLQELTMAWTLDADDQASHGILQTPKELFTLFYTHFWQNHKGLGLKMYLFPSYGIDPYHSI